MAHQRRTRYRNLEWETIPSGSLGPIESDDTQEWTEVEHDPVRDREIQGRLLFMTFTAMFARSVLAELQQDCYPLFIEYTGQYTIDLRPPPNGMQVILIPSGPVILSLSWSSLVSDKDAEALRQPILIWCTRWNLDSDWCRDHALSVMLRWLAKAGARQTNDCDGIDEQAILELHSIGPRPYENPVPTIGPPPGMLPYHFPESEASYLQLTEYLANDQIERSPLLSNAEVSHRRAFVRAILDEAACYVRKVREHHESERGLKLVKGRSHNLRNLQWAVQFQVLKMEYTEIAGKDFEVSTVMRAVKRVLKEIGLPERADSGPGRPAGRKDSPGSVRQRLKRRPRPGTQKTTPNVE
jgi:hypothetical protein